MQLNEMPMRGGVAVDGYGPGFFRVGGQIYHGAISVLVGQVAGWGGYGDSESLCKAAHELDILFVGTGPEITPIPSDLRQALLAVGIEVEIMASPTACRTYNVLLSEGRRIGLALLPV